MDNVAIIGVAVGLGVVAFLLSCICLVGLIWCLVEIRIERKTKYEVIHNAVASAQEEDLEEYQKYDPLTHNLMRGEL